MYIHNVTSEQNIHRTHRTPVCECNFFHFILLLYLVLCAPIQMAIQRVVCGWWWWWILNGNHINFFLCRIQSYSFDYEWTLTFDNKFVKISPHFPITFFSIVHVLYFIIVFIYFVIFFSFCIRGNRPLFYLLKKWMNEWMINKHLQQTHIDAIVWSHHQFVYVFECWTIKFPGSL